jgi:hypothetical protein
LPERPGEARRKTNRREAGINEEDPSERLDKRTGVDTNGEILADR